MKHIRVAAKIMLKILEICHWVATGLMTAVAIISVAVPQYLKYVMDVEALLQDGEASVYGLTVSVVTANGELNHPALLLFAIGAVVIFVLIALAFRNFHRILQNAETGTPFSEENILRMKRIGLNCILVSPVGFIVSNLLRFVFGPDVTEASMDLSFVIMGIIVWCLTEFFAYGATLEKDVGGLV